MPPKASKGSASERAALAQYLAARKERALKAAQGAGSLPERSEASIASIGSVHRQLGDACEAAVARKNVHTNDMFEGAPPSTLDYTRGQHYVCLCVPMCCILQSRTVALSMQEQVLGRTVTLIATLNAVPYCDPA